MTLSVKVTLLVIAEGDIWFQLLDLDLGLRNLGIHSTVSFMVRVACQGAYSKK